MPIVTDKIVMEITRSYEGPHEDASLEQEAACFEKLIGEFFHEFPDVGIKVKVLSREKVED